MSLLKLNRHIFNIKHRHLASIANNDNTIRIGCASGFWGDTPTAVPQLLNNGRINYLMFDYLSEVTMSLMTAAKSKNPEMGYAPDFVMFAMAPHLKQIKNQGVKVIANAGGINTLACVEALKQACKKADVDLKIASVTGDDLIPMKKDLFQGTVLARKFKNPGKPIQINEMSTGQPLPKTIHSVTAYFGAGPIVKALEMGADIVVTGRTADSALALAPCVHEFQWNLEEDFDLLSSGSLAGHLIECGGQATGGLFTDWKSVAKGYANLGFPVVEMSSNGNFELGKPPKTGGIISEAAVAEQMLYEVGNPARYMLPDVNCDFTQVKLNKAKNDQDEDIIQVSGAKGIPPTENYKVCATYMDGFKATSVSIVLGGQASGKAKAVANAVIGRSSAIFKHMGMQDFDAKYVTTIGAEDSFGANAQPGPGPREAALWMSVQHKDKNALNLWAREIASAGTGMAPGLCQLVGGRPKVSPCLKLFSFLFPKTSLPATIQLNEDQITYTPQTSVLSSNSAENESHENINANLTPGDKTYKLEELAYARSGDKGNSCNIGVIARNPKYLPYIKQQLTADVVHEYFKHLIDEDGGQVHRYDVPGIHAVNFLLEKSLGGGGIASLRPDPLGKAFAQMLLSFELKDMPDLESLE